MNLAEKGDNLTKQRDDLLKRRNDLLQSLKEVEIGIANYEGAISYNKLLLDEQNNIKEDNNPTIKTDISQQDTKLESNSASITEETIN